MHVFGEGDCFDALEDVGQRYDVQRPLTLDAICSPRQSPRACRSLAELNAAWKCLSGVRERLGDYASP